MSIFAAIAGFGMPELTFIIGSVVILSAIIYAVITIRKGFLKSYRNQK
jgi:hypothetical protein